MLQHLFGVEVGDEERDIITLTSVSGALYHTSPFTAYLDWLPAQNEESFRTLGQESCELVH